MKDSTVSARVENNVKIEAEDILQKFLVIPGFLMVKGIAFTIKKPGITKNFCRMSSASIFTLFSTRALTVESFISNASR